MDCEEVQTRLPWLLGGSLEGAERQAMAAHLEDCLACRRGLDQMRQAATVFGAHLPPSALVSLGWGRGPEGAAADTARRHLESCPSCAEELALLRESREEESAAASTAVPRPWRVVRYAALAAGLIVAFSAGQWWSVGRRAGGDGDAAERQRVTDRLSALDREGEELRRSQTELRERIEQLASPQLNLPVVELIPGSARLRSEGAAESVLLVPAGAARVAIILHSPTPSSRPVTIELRDAAGRTLWKGSGLRAGALGGYALAVPAALLPEGPLTIAVVGEATRPIETYTVRVRPQP